MRVSDEMAEMVERMCHAYNDAVPQHDSAQLDGMRAALEAALDGCKIVKPREYQVRQYNGGLRKSARIHSALPVRMKDKRFALVPVED